MSPRIAFNPPEVLSAEESDNRLHHPLTREMLLTLGFSVGDNVRHYALPIAFPLGHQPTMADLFAEIRDHTLRDERERVRQRLDHLLNGII